MSFYDIVQIKAAIQRSLYLKHINIYIFYIRSKNLDLSIKNIPYAVRVIITDKKKIF